MERFLFQGAAEHNYKNQVRVKKEDKARKWEYFPLSALKNFG